MKSGEKRFIPPPGEHRRTGIQPREPEGDKGKMQKESATASSENLSRAGPGREPPEDRAEPEVPPLSEVMPGFGAWRPGQAEAVRQVLQWLQEREAQPQWLAAHRNSAPLQERRGPLRELAGSRYLQLEAPTGSGKSVIAAAAARLSGRHHPD